MKNLYLEQVLKQRLIPQPKEISFQDGECLIQDGISVELKTAENEEEFGETVAELFSEYWYVSPEIKLSHSKTAEDFLEDQYEVQVTRKKITLISHCSKGLQLAMKTLRQLAEPIRGTAFLGGFVLQTCKIQDYADSENVVGRVIARETWQSIGRCLGMFCIVMCYLVLPETAYLKVSVIFCSSFPIILSTYATIYHRKRDRLKKEGLLH